MVPSDNLTQAELLKLCSYDRDTGKFNNRTYSTNQAGYEHIKVGGRLYVSHRLAWLYSYGEWPRSELDHINGVKNDNRLSNLRQVNRSQNMQNLKGARRDNKTGVLGVCLHKASGKYRAQIQKAGVKYDLGVFSTVEEARSIRELAVASMFTHAPHQGHAA